MLTPPLLTQPPSARPLPLASDGGVFLSANTQNGPAPFHRIKLASAMRCKRFLAGARCKLWWMAPAWCAAPRPLRPPPQRCRDPAHPIFTLLPFAASPSSFPAASASPISERPSK